MNKQRVLYPDVQTYKDLFEEVRLAPTSPGPEWYFLADRKTRFPISGSYGGERSWTTSTPKPDGERIRRHRGAKFYSVYVRVRPGIEVPKIHGMGKSSLSAMTWGTGETLITVHAANCSAEDWLALLPNAGTLAALLSQTDRDFLYKERMAESSAWHGSPHASDCPHWVDEPCTCNVGLAYRGGASE